LCGVGLATGEVTGAGVLLLGAAGHGADLRRVSLDRGASASFKHGGARAIAAESDHSNGTAVMPFAWQSVVTLLEPSSVHLSILMFLLRVCYVCFNVVTAI
jgi:hypothetical protein